MPLRTIPKAERPEVTGIEGSVAKIFFWVTNIPLAINDGPTRHLTDFLPSPWDFFQHVSNFSGSLVASYALSHAVAARFNRSPQQVMAIATFAGIAVLTAGNLMTETSLGVQLMHSIHFPWGELFPHTVPDRADSEWGMFGAFSGSRMVHATAPSGVGEQAQTDASFPFESADDPFLQPAIDEPLED